LTGIALLSRRQTYFDSSVTQETFLQKLKRLPPQALAGLPDFSWYVIPKLEKCTKSTQNVPNGHKIPQISVKYSDAHKIYQYFPI
jgi:hypothetical protein